MKITLFDWLMRCRDGYSFIPSSNNYIIISIPMKDKEFKYSIDIQHLQTEETFFNVIYNFGIFLGENGLKKYSEGINE